MQIIIIIGLLLYFLIVWMVEKHRIVSNQTRHIITLHRKLTFDDVRKITDTSYSYLYNGLYVDFFNASSPDEAKAHHAKNVAKFPSKYKW